MTTFKMFKQVPKIIFQKKSFDFLDKVVNSYRKEAYIVFLIDSIHIDTGLRDRISINDEDLILDLDISTEPKTDYVDKLCDIIRNEKGFENPDLVVGIGGGSSLDIAKAVSVLMTNQGGAADYQGWDLVKNPAIIKLGIPTLSGTGAESSRTAVLTSKNKKFGINSDYSMFDLIMLDSSLLKTVPNEQCFYTGMDCFIHSVESLDGSFINSFGNVYAKNALELSSKYFMKENQEDEELMIASFMGGASVANSEVGVCHALSYGLSLELGFRHGIANCIVFNQLEEFYGKYVDKFKKMLFLNEIQLPHNISQNISQEKMVKMIEMTLRMERPLESALGSGWRKKFTPEKIESLYKRM